METTPSASRQRILILLIGLCLVLVAIAATILYKDMVAIDAPRNTKSYLGTPP
jgi:flagellar basal body-associated protein FliL